MLVGPVFWGSTGTPAGSLPEHVADTLEGLKVAYSTARFCKIMAVVTAVGTLIFLWLKKAKTRQIEKQCLRKRAANGRLLPFTCRNHPHRSLFLLLRRSALPRDIATAEL